MIVQYGYQAYGNRQQAALGVGVAVLWLSGSGIVGQSGPLVGKWSNILRLDTTNTRHKLETRSERMNLEVHNDLDTN